MQYLNVLFELIASEKQNVKAVSTEVDDLSGVEKIKKKMQIHFGFGLGNENFKKKILHLIMVQDRVVAVHCNEKQTLCRH